ncbi:MAG: nuclear transport factor 2 family protein [Betaproteobacteria bacterium]|nr:nuclear transport factor 2 family protein [Betaproteobacteria bacterium]
MNAEDLIDLAKTYVSLSNRHQIKQIDTMFMEDATYHSSFFGEYKGRIAISEMMTSFFTRFLDAYWDVTEYLVIEENGVEFKFVMTATDAASGERVERHGLECIYFSPEGLISHIAVSKPNEATSIGLI